MMANFQLVPRLQQIEPGSSTIGAINIHHMLLYVVYI